MKKNVMLALVALLALTACVSDFKSFSLKRNEKEPKERRTVAVRDFERLELRGSTNVVYTQGDSMAVVVEGPKDQVENVSVSVRGNKLLVADKQSRRMGISVGNSVRDVVVRITSPDLIGVSLAGSGNFTQEGLLDTDRLELSLKGSGDFTVEDVVCDELDAELVGSGDMVLRHVVTQQARLSLVGSGDLGASLVNVDKTSISLLGSGDIEVDFDNCQQADCHLRGSGDIELKGHLGQLSRQKSGSGDIDTDKLTLKK